MTFVPHQPTGSVAGHAVIAGSTSARMPSWPSTPTRRRRPWNSACPPGPANAGPNWPPSTSATAAASAYVDARLTDGDHAQLCRLRYGGSAHHWGFAIYRASHDDYEDSFLPTGLTGRHPEDALDTACGLYLGDPTAWT